MYRCQIQYTLGPFGRFDEERKAIGCSCDKPFARFAAYTLMPLIHIRVPVEMTGCRAGGTVGREGGGSTMVQPDRGP